MALKEIDINKIVEDRLRTEKELITPTFREDITDKVAELGGSWKFIIGFTLFFFGWITFNLWIYDFDSYPFILLNLILSSIAVFQAPFILMSQNRMAEIDRRQHDNDYKVDMKIEIQMINLHEKIDELINLANKKESYGFNAS